MTKKVLKFENHEWFESTLEVQNEYDFNDYDIVIFPNGVECICYDSFTNNIGTKLVILPESIVEIDKCAFSNCKDIIIKFDSVDQLICCDLKFNSVDEAKNVKISFECEIEFINKLIEKCLLNNKYLINVHDYLIKNENDYSIDFNRLFNFTDKELNNLKLMYQNDCFIQKVQNMDDRIMKLEKIIHDQNKLIRSLVDFLYTNDYDTSTSRND